MGEIAIRADRLSKQYRIGLREPYGTFAGSVAQSVGSIFNKKTRESSDQREILWALKDVSFDVDAGDAIGIIGRNGAGKSTLLKILSRVTRPTEGQAFINGRVGSLLEVGTGFHSELTGRENVYLSGAILGMKRSEIDRKFKEIVEFSEVEKFINTPLKYYSSGMQMRLAFAVAAHLEPQILLLDEVLAVGDLAFQKKCLGKMDSVAHEGKTILFVSHNLVAVNSLCNKAIMLEKGRVVDSGRTNDVINTYMRSVQSILKDDLKYRTDRTGDGKLRFTDVKFLDGNLDEIECFITGKDAVIALEYETGNGKPLNDVFVAFSIKDQMGTQLTIACNEFTQKSFDVVPGRGYFICNIPRLPLVSGKYMLNLMCRVNGIVADWVIDTSEFVIEAGDYYGTGKNLDREQSLFLIDNRWKVAERIGALKPENPVRSRNDNRA